MLILLPRGCMTDSSITSSSYLSRHSREYDVFDLKTHQDFQVADFFGNLFPTKLSTLICKQAWY